MFSIAAGIMSGAPRPSQNALLDCNFDLMPGRLAMGRRHQKTGASDVFALTDN
jgi:hypothetical protein